jgi:hypothetical protein
MDFLYLQRGWEKTFHFSNKMLGYIRRSTFNIREFAIRRTLYLSLVRSHLGYAHMSPKTQVWAPHSYILASWGECVGRYGVSTFATNNNFFLCKHFNVLKTSRTLLPIHQQQQ